MSNKIKTHSRNYRRILLLAVILVILLIGGGFAFHHFSKPSSTPSGVVKPTNTISYAPSTPSDNAANNQRKSSTTTSTPANTTLTSPSSTPSFSVTVSRATSIGSNSITTAATVNGTTSGTCTFNFSKSQSGAVVVSSQPEAVQTSNQSAMCAPETVQMPSNGSWYVSVSVVYNGSTAVANWAANPVQL